MHVSKSKLLEGVLIKFYVQFFYYLFVPCSVIYMFLSNIYNIGGVYIDLMSQMIVQYIHEFHYYINYVLMQIVFP